MLTGREKCHPNGTETEETEDWMMLTGREVHRLNESGIRNRGCQMLFAPCKGNSNVSKEGLSCPFRAPVTAHDTYPGRCPGLLWAALSGRKQHILPRMRVQGFHVLGLLSSRKVIPESSDLSVCFTKKLLLKICNLEMEMAKVWVGITAFYLRFCESYPFGVRKDTF